MDANRIVDALKPAVTFLLESLKRNDAIAKAIHKVGLEAIDKLPENPTKGEVPLEERFDANKLLQALQVAFAAGSKEEPITVGDLEACSLVAQVLLDLQRYYRWRDLSYVNRVARAGCRRSINTLPTGPVIRVLQTHIQRTLRESTK